MTALPTPPSMPRAARRQQTARLLQEASEADGPTRDALVNEVIELNIGVAHAIARRFKDRGIPLEDLEQVACMALVRAAQKFDATQDRDFLTYAVPTMTGEVKRHFRDHGWTIRPPRRIQEIQSRVISTYRKESDTGRAPSIEAVADRLGLPAEDVREALTASGCFTPMSLDVPQREGGDLTLGQALAGDDEVEGGALEARLVLEPVLSSLSERDRRVLHLRFVEEKTQREIGQELGLSQMRVSRLLASLLSRLRDELGHAVA